MRKFQFLGFILLFSMVFAACVSQRKPGRDIPKRKTDNKGTTAFYIENELIVWGGSATVKNQLRSEIQLLSPGSQIKVDTCESCDGQLELWSGPAVKTFVSGEVASSGTRTRTRAQGDGGGLLYYSVNFVIQIPVDGIKERGRDRNDLKLAGGSGSTIAVFDTGIDPALISYPALGFSCKANGEKGWNFVDDNDDVRDNHPPQHGTIVTKMILDSYGKQDANILPVKVLGKNGEGELFDLLCGFAYAAGSKATIINSSLGFYCYDNEAPKILEDYIAKVLPPDQILLVTAAGNVDAVEDGKALSKGLDPKDLRNIDKHLFYPAALAGSRPNVITVTTIGKDSMKVSPAQNFSKNTVNIGVPGDDGYQFKHPYGSGQLISGSSYAAPVFVGHLYSWLNGANVSTDTEETLSAMQSAGIVVSHRALMSVIRQGRHLKR